MIYATSAQPSRRLSSGSGIQAFGACLPWSKRDFYEPGTAALFGAPALDALLRTGLARAALHEIYAASDADTPVATGLALALAVRLGGQRPFIWVRQDFLGIEAGHPYLPGLVEFGLVERETDPVAITLVRARDGQAALQAGLESARCPAIGVVLIELRGEIKALDLTASRRLALAARVSGATVLLARSAAPPQPSAAETRWQVKAVISHALAANASGNPAFSLTLLRHRGGLAIGEWHLEWNRDRRCFEDRAAFQPDICREDSTPPLSGALVPVPFNRSGMANGTEAPFRKTG